MGRAGGQALDESWWMRPPRICTALKRGGWLVIDPMPTCYTGCTASFCAAGG